MPRLLVVDDEPIFVDFIERFADRHFPGMACASRRSPETALASVTEARPDALLVDLSFPGRTSGFDLIASLRADPENATIPIAVVSGRLLAGDARSACAELGVQHFLQKPPEQRELMACLRFLIEPTKVARVLIVEDEPEQAELTRYLLADRFEIALSASGASALALAAERTFDLVVLDLELPDMRGAEVYRRLRQAPANPGVPIIVTTGFSQPERWLPQSGYQHTLAKPFAPDLFLATVDLALKGGSSRPPISLDPVGRLAIIGGRTIILPGMRFELLRALIAHPEGVSIEGLISFVWSGNADPGTVRKTIQRLRGGLGPDRDRIVATDGGYRFVF